jgi:peroxiredoxin
MAMKKTILFLLAFTVCAASAGAAEIKLKDLSGQEVNISTYTQSSKKPLLLFFWTSWCPFCMRELKTLNQRKQQLGDAADLIAVNAGESKSIVERAVKNYKLESRVLLDESNIATDSYGIVGVPTFVLIDRKGSVSAKENSFPEAQIKKLSSQ